MITRPGTSDRQSIASVKEYRGLPWCGNDCVLDLGANIGAFALFAFKHGALWVHAYEPDPENAKLFRMNVPRAVFFERAVGLEFKSRQPLKGRTYWERSIMGNASGPVVAGVEVVPWDYVLNLADPHIIKCDVEGAEVLYDWSILSDKVRGVAIEFHAIDDKMMNIMDTIESQGFELTRDLQIHGDKATAVWGRT